MSFPKHAQIVHKGPIFSVYQREQKMFDGSTAIFEGIERPDTVKIIATQGDKIIMLEETQPHLDYSYKNLPGGREDEGESPLDCAKRELLEEAGMEAENWKEWKKYYFEGKNLWNGYFFIAQNCKKVQEPELDGGEKIKVYKTSFEEFFEFVVNKTDMSMSDAFLIIDFLKAEKEGKIDKLKKEIFE